MDKIVLASGNKGKLAEFAHLFSPMQISIIAQGELGVQDVPETGTTFVENAIIKARHACQVTGLPALSDDSGLVVEALGGAPGIYSSRYSESSPGADDASDAANIDKLLNALADSPAGAARRAHFMCVLVFMRHADDPTPLICQGQWQGEIALQRAGEHGFGYDPVFYCPQLQQHAAQCSKAEKATVSHRALALHALLQQMQPLLSHSAI